MSNGYGLSFKKAVLQTARSFKRACSAAKKNQELVIQPFSYAYPSGAGASQIVAVYSVPITTPWSILYPFTKPSSSFVAVVRWVAGGVTFRYKLWSAVGEVLPYPSYIGETIPAGAAIEIWTASANPAVLASVWKLQLGILEDPAFVCDTDGTDITPTVCVPSFASMPVSQKLTQCAV